MKHLQEKKNWIRPVTSFLVSWNFSSQGNGVLFLFEWKFMFIFFNVMKLTFVGSDRVQVNDICDASENCDRFLRPMDLIEN